MSEPVHNTYAEGCSQRIARAWTVGARCEVCDAAFQHACETPARLRVERLTRTGTADSEVVMRVARYLDRFESELPSPTIGPVWPGDGSAVTLLASDLRALLYAATGLSHPTTPPTPAQAATAPPSPENGQP